MMLLFRLIAQETREANLVKRVDTRTLAVSFFFPHNLSSGTGSASQDSLRLVLLWSLGHRPLKTLILLLRGPAWVARTSKPQLPGDPALADLSGHHRRSRGHRWRIT